MQQPVAKKKIDRQPKSVQVECQLSANAVYLGLKRFYEGHEKKRAASTAREGKQRSPKVVVRDPKRLIPKNLLQKMLTTKEKKSTEAIEPKRLIPRDIQLAVAKPPVPKEVWRRRCIYCTKPFESTDKRYKRCTSCRDFDAIWARYGERGPAGVRVIGPSVASPLSVGQQ